MVLYFIAVFLISYMLGSVNFGIIISRLFYKNDIRSFGSGNAGATNAYRTYGAKTALIVLVGDILKGASAVLLARFAAKYLGIPDYAVYLAGVCAVLGHMFPVFFKFKGGKGVATAVGAAALAEPVSFAVLFFVFVLIFLLTRYVSLSSIICAAVYPVSVLIFVYFNALPARALLIRTVSAAVVGLLIIFKHRGNIEKLRKGTESKTEFKKR